MNRDSAWKLLRKYNRDVFHLRHALTMESVMKNFAVSSGSGKSTPRKLWFMPSVRTAGTSP